MSSRNQIGKAARETLRVAYVVKRFPRLSETFVLNEILELERQGVEVAIFSLRRPTDEPRHQLLSGLQAKVTYLPSCGVNSARRTATQQNLRRTMGPTGDLLLGKSEDAVADLTAKARALAQAIHASAIRHIHAHFSSDATTVSCLASMLSGVPFSFTAHARDIYHTYVSPEVDNRVRRTKLHAAVFTVTVSDYNRGHLRSIAGEEHCGKIHRLYNGIDLARFACSGFENREPRLILAVGRLVEKKGFSDLVKALGHLNVLGHDFECVVAGDGPLRASLEEQSRLWRLGDRLSFAGALPQDQVLDLMRRASVFALPCVVTPSGDRDGLPTVLLEALACGLPAISTDVAGVPEIIVDEETGLLVPPNDPMALAASLSRVLGDQPLARRLAHAGRQKAEHDFDLRKSVRTLRRLFTETSSQFRKPGLARALNQKATGPSLVASSDRI